MAFGLGLVFLLGSAVLFGIAACSFDSVVHFHSAHLSLPITPFVTILAILLPIISLFNSFIYPSLLHSARNSSNPLHRLSPTILQTLQGLLTTVLATLLLEDVVPSAAAYCVLENRWMRMFRAHDGESIRLIQDTLNCCGFNTVKDKAYPFNKDASTCADMFGRNLACRAPWRAALRGSAGADFAVVVAVGLLQLKTLTDSSLMQIFSLLMTREGTNWWTAWRSVGWHRRQRADRRENRPLLTDVSDADEVDVEQQQEGSPRPRGYQSLPGSDEENRPRVEPATIQRFPSEWGSSDHNNQGEF
ncbi:hypothetical protein Trco_004357 [Trichoderma cornu-damae]|uniref:Tetraspanin Tsp3 n=1 Tax=Trichoderma cornu-damae TaxID=654480 RepID=A0A9P8TWV1_9HYPO|nr:hypothetical protein Trco_004357 [Trichoderma cornu-damae]